MENKAIECQRNGKELYKRLLADARMQNAELIETARMQNAELLGQLTAEQTARMIAEFQIFEERNSARFASIRKSFEDEAKAARADAKAIRRYGWLMAADMVVISVVIAWIILGDNIPLMILECLVFSVGLFGCSLGWAMCEISRRFGRC